MSARLSKHIFQVLTVTKQQNTGLVSQRILHMDSKAGRKRALELYDEKKVIQRQIELINKAGSNLLY